MDPKSKKDEKSKDRDIGEEAPLPSRTMDGMKDFEPDKTKFRSVAAEPMGSCGLFTQPTGQYASAQSDFSRMTFDLPDNRKFAVGGNFSLNARTAEVAERRAQVGSAFGGEAFVLNQSHTFIDKSNPGRSPVLKSASSSNLDDVAPGPLPGVEQISSSLLVNGKTENNCRICFKPDLDLKQQIIPAINTVLSNAKCDYDFTVKKCKWKIVCGLECSFVHMVGQIYKVSSEADAGVTYVFEVARREGDSLCFRKVFQVIKDGIQALSTPGEDFDKFIASIDKHPSMQTRPQLPADMISSAPSLDEEALEPLCTMADSKIIDHQLYAAQVTARLVTEDAEKRRYISQSSLIGKLVATVSKIDLCNVLPLEHAILRHVSYTLALCSEDQACLKHLAGAGAHLLCFRIVVGVFEADGSEKCIKCSVLDVEARREAARCLANLIAASPDQMISHLRSSLKKKDELLKWIKFVDNVDDEKLRTQCRRVSQYIRAIPV